MAKQQKSETKGDVAKAAPQKPADVDEAERAESDEGEESDEEEEEEEEEEADAAADEEESDEEEEEEEEEEADAAADEEESDEEEEDTEDPYWWTPHLVLSVLLLAGIGGFLGLFNRWMVPLFVTHDEPAGSAAAHAPKPTTPTGAPSAAAPRAH